jgi:hypothetical protein
LPTLINPNASQSREKEVNEELRKEAEYFGDIVIVPFMDSYDLVVLKTIAIAEYGVCNCHLDFRGCFCFTCSIPCFNLIA